MSVLFNQLNQNHSLTSQIFKRGSHGHDSTKNLYLIFKIESALLWNENICYMY